MLPKKIKSVTCWLLITSLVIACVYTKTNYAKTTEELIKEYEENYVDTGGDAGESEENLNYYTDVYINGRGESVITDFPFYYTNISGDENATASEKQFVCVAAAIDSYYHAEFVYPREIREKYSYEAGKEEEVLKAILSDTVHEVNTDEFYTARAADAIDGFGCAVIHITNPSPFGKQGDWILIKTIFTDGTAAINDPIEKNQKTCSVDFEEYQPIYSIAEMITALGNNQIYYIEEIPQDNTNNSEEAAN